MVSPAREVDAETVQEVERLSRELERSENRFRDVIEHNADAILVIGTDGEICFANTEATKLFGKPVHELEGHPFGFPAVAGETTEIDLLRDGASYVVEMRVVESHWEGKPACIATLRDATDRKRAEESARILIREQSARQVSDEAAQRFRFLSEASAQLAAHVDYGAILALLPQLCTTMLADWAIAYSIENGVLHRVETSHKDARLDEVLRQISHHSSEPGALAPMIDAVRTRQPLVVRNVTREWIESNVHDASTRKLFNTVGLSSLVIVPLIAHDRVVGALTVVKTNRHFDEADVTLTKDLATRAALSLDSARLYTEAREANQTKTDFLAVISHDLRTPLNAILGYADLLAMGIPDPLTEGSIQSVSRIRTSAGHLIYLIDQLLAYARLESGHDEPHFANVDIAQIADEVSVVIQPLAAARGLAFKVELSAGPVTIRSDADKLRQILLNLVSNAVKYTEYGEVCLATEELDDSVHLTVSDTGAGIAEEHLPRIFEPFWQVSTTQRSPSTGTGLGLSVVRQLVGVLHGTIEVDSRVGQGTTFTVKLPRRSSRGA